MEKKNEWMTDWKKVSKYLSYILRHHPEEIGLNLDEGGWANVNALLEKSKENGRNISYETLKQVVRMDNKNRYSFTRGKEMIRCNQGHSIKVDLGLEPMRTPIELFHGTAERFKDLIMESGIKKMSRHHVHLSKDTETAKTVGARHGKPIVLKVDAQSMAEDGIKFYLSENGVWLTDYIDKKYIIKDNEDE